MISSCTPLGLSALRARCDAPSLNPADYEVLAYTVPASHPEVQRVVADGEDVILMLDGPLTPGASYMLKLRAERAACPFTGRC